jgi:serine/threonine-protein kinase
VAFDPPLTDSEIDQAFSGEFRVVSPLTTGGQGVVFKALTKSRSLVALKIYFVDQIEERTLREIGALKAVRGETLVELHDAGRCSIRGQNCFYIATAFIAGETVAITLTRGAMELERVARVGYDIALAIESLWEKRIVHRDIKPDNIMLSASARAVLIDLGVARHLALKTLTTTGKTWGTQGYLSPEQARGGALTCKSDLFALGIVLQECLAGHHPTGRQQHLLLGGGPKTAGLRPSVPQEIINVVDAMVHRSAVYRPHPATVVSELSRFISASP